MKIVGYILSFYMLLLAVVPCCIFDECADEKPVTALAANHTEGDEDCGTCSPFFSCEGCASVSTTPEPLTFRIENLFILKVFTGFLCPVVSDIQYEFWQPPKLHAA